jgi:hypothetical protein
MKSVCGAITTLDGIGHTLLFLIRGFRASFFIAFCIVPAELAVNHLIRAPVFGTSSGLRQQSRFRWVRLLPPAFYR